MMQTSRHNIEPLRVAIPQCAAAGAGQSASRILRDRASSPQLADGSADTETAAFSPKLICATFCVVVSILSGCAANQKPRARTFAWATATNVRPVAPEIISSAVSNEDLFADLGLDVPAPPSPIAGMPSGPSRPRVAVVPAGNPGAPPTPEAPMIAPQLSPEQTAAAQQQTAASVSVAEKNIAASKGRSLNAMQSDLASKVRSFLAEAREAAHVGDWTRASNAAKKAEVLSEELASSL
ncbi:MAG: hypothetical protein JO260_00480 [Acidobacteria bacterium]|nr:hypothetical protein [Acidobacteriota bacterium]